MRSKRIQIRTGSIDEAASLAGLIPEFSKVGPADFRKRLHGRQHMILVAAVDGVTVGFKAGYVNEDHFYSWLGGVLPPFRNKGVAARLAREQERRAQALGLLKIRLRTKNKFRAMLVFAIRNGFEITGIVHDEQDGGIKIEMEKVLDKPIH